MAAFFQSSCFTRISAPARMGSRASPSRPRARRRKAASLSSQAWSPSARAGAGRDQGSAKRQATAPRSAPKAPSFLVL